MSKKRSISPDEPNLSESGIAQKSASVFAAARRMHLLEGQVVLVSRGNAVYSVSADGESHFVKNISAPRKVQRGMKITLR